MSKSPSTLRHLLDRVADVIRHAIPQPGPRQVVLGLRRVRPGRRRCSAPRRLRRPRARTSTRCSRSPLPSSITRRAPIERASTSSVTPTLRPTIGNPRSRPSASISSSTGSSWRACRPAMYASISGFTMSMPRRYAHVALRRQPIGSRADDRRPRAPTPASSCCPSTRRIPAFDPTTAAGGARRRSRSRAARIRRCTGAGCGRCASTPAWAPPTTRTARFRYLLEHGQTGLSTAFDLPDADGVGLRPSAGRGRGRQDRRRDRLASRTWPAASPRSRSTGSRRR